MPDHSVHDHSHDSEHGEFSEMDLRVRALQSVLTQKGYIDPSALAVLVDTYQTQVGPRNGAQVVARSWVDAKFREWLRRDATQAIASLGYSGRQGEHMVAVENTSERHNLVVDKQISARGLAVQLNLNQSDLSRSLQLAKLPEEVIKA